MLQLNGFSIEIAGGSLTVLKSKIAPTDVKETRRSLGDDWFTMYHEGHLYSLAKNSNTSGGLGETELLVISDHLGLRFVKAMLDQAMRAVFEAYDPVRDRPFTFLARNVDLVALAAENLETS
ncbi:hypothetical protein Q31b_31370 [Novipirellula aureliae]|uniref:Uncharacterized protein n=1 Tax=Novipirellula aureliae TaxID=2527966 RepID=A0A5C6DT16_9BACT|nr:hypothetical protein [Novipirellula aureliae]TWU39822.1 hypothetical protein Q31b_31370 [Novipirellula aureliae]